MSGITQYLSFGDWLISLSILSSVLIQVATCQNFNVLRLKFCCVYSAHFVYPFLHRWTWEGFLLLAMVKNAAVSKGVRVSVRVLLSIILSLCLELKLLDYAVTLCLMFVQNRHTVFHGDCMILHSHQRCRGFGASALDEPFLLGLLAPKGSVGKRCAIVFAWPGPSKREDWGGVGRADLSGLKR